MPSWSTSTSTIRPRGDHLRRRTQRIDKAYRRWSRQRADVDALRELQDAISDFMAEAFTS